VRVALDTNVVAAALLWGGTPKRLIELAGDADPAHARYLPGNLHLTPAECLQRIGG